MAGSRCGPRAGCGALEWVLQSGVVEVLVMGVTRPPTSGLLGALEWVLQSGLGSEWVLTTSFEINVFMYYSF